VGNIQDNARICTATLVKQHGKAVTKGTRLPGLSRLNHLPRVSCQSCTFAATSRNPTAAKKRQASHRSIRKFSSHKRKFHLVKNTIKVRLAPSDEIQMANGRFRGHIQAQCQKPVQDASAYCRKIYQSVIEHQALCCTIIREISAADHWLTIWKAFSTSHSRAHKKRTKLLSGRPAAMICR
jgi:hypothetical protein